LALGITVTLAAKHLFSESITSADAPQAYFEIALPGQPTQVGESQPEIRAPGPKPLSPRKSLAPRQNTEVDSPPSNQTWVNVTVTRGDNLSLIFSRLKLSKRDLHGIVSQDRENARFRKLKPGQIIRISAAGSSVNSLVLELDELNSLWAERNGESFELRTESIVPEIRIATARSGIAQSLFVDGQKAGLSDALIMALADIFGWDVDFALDIRPDDHFSVVFEEIYKDDKLIKQGRILAAEFVNRGKPLRAILFPSENGDLEYYSDKGHAMRKTFLRSPVNFTRISSRFNLRRKHPVLNTIRAHRGVDYAAPHGTPIRATANGKIRSIGTNGGYGRTIEVQHGETYRTLYAHLSRFGKGLKRGSTIRQGKIIGYVGKSGLATGPHLHYEFRVNGIHRNPLTIELPKAAPIATGYRSEFEARAAPLLRQLNLLSPTPTNSGEAYVASLGDTLRADAANKTKH